MQKRYTRQNPDLKACAQRLLNQKAGKKVGRKEGSVLPKAGTALLSRPVRTMFTMKNRKRVQGRVALGA